VIDFNYRDPVFGRGSGIFLHVATHSPTAGCVSLPERDLLGVLRWMRPGVRILIGPTRWLRAPRPSGRRARRRRLNRPPESFTPLLRHRDDQPSRAAVPST
jgi:hypothetical protein